MIVNRQKHSNDLGVERPRRIGPFCPWFLPGSHFGSQMRSSNIKALFYWGRSGGRCFPKALTGNTTRIGLAKALFDSPTSPEIAARVLGRPHRFVRRVGEAYPKNGDTSSASWQQSLLEEQAASCHGRLRTGYPPVAIVKVRRPAPMRLTSSENLFTGSQRMRKLRGWIDRISKTLQFLQTCLDRSPVRAQLIEQVKEIPVVLGVPQMADFVGYHVVDADRRGFHQLRVEVDATVPVRTAPALRHSQQPHLWRRELARRTPHCPLREPG